jgi:hypothetical protein
MSPQALGHIAGADVVFYHATNGVAAAQIRRYSNEAVDLYAYYGEGKPRRTTYIQMAELMLREVRNGRAVVGAFHGHPGLFVSPARRALAIAEAEGYETALIPAISAPDCLFADLRVDPGVLGCQIIMASKLLQEETLIATTGHVVLLQVSAVGDRGFSFSGYRNSKLSLLFDRLIDVYGEEHDCVYYMAAIFPGLGPEVSIRKLKYYRDAGVQRSVHAGMLYLPPTGMSFASVIAGHVIRSGEGAYGVAERRAIAELDDHETPPLFPSRTASDALLRSMSRLALEPDSLRQYARSPHDFVADCEGLTSAEREALCRQRGSALRKVTTTRMPSTGVG